MGLDVIKLRSRGQSQGRSWLGLGLGHVLHFALAEARDQVGGWDKAESLSLFLRSLLFRSFVRPLAGIS